MEGMKHPTMCLITDGLLSGGKPHPRTYAAFPRFIARYVREKRLLTLEEAVRKMTSSTALKLRMKRKGFIMPGMDALAPERTDTNNGLALSPNFFPFTCSSQPTASKICVWISPRICSSFA